MSNNKGLIRNAYKQFLRDLKEDKDFISYKKKCFHPEGGSFGTIVAGNRQYVLQLVETNNIIKQSKS